MSLNYESEEPRQWHSCEGCEPMTCADNSNCYSYALDAPNYHWSVPGFGFTKVPAEDFFDSFKKFFSAYSVGALLLLIEEGVAKDGLIKVSESEFDAGLDLRDGSYPVALFLSSDEAPLPDYHFIRQHPSDPSGLWTHKNGWRDPTNEDSAGNLIHDPRTAVMGSFLVFKSFFLVPPGGISLTKTFPQIVSATI